MMTRAPAERRMILARRATSRLKAHSGKPSSVSVPTVLQGLRNPPASVSSLIWATWLMLFGLCPGSITMIFPASGLGGGAGVVLGVGFAAGLDEVASGAAGGSAALAVSLC